MQLVGAWLAAATLALPGPAAAQTLRTYVVDGDAIPASLTGAPSLAGAGARWSAGQLRLRIVDASRLNPATIMPSYYRVDGLQRVGTAWRGKPILSAEHFYLGGRAGRAQISTRIRLADSQKIVAVAKLSDGSFWSASVDVVVTLAACTEEVI